MNKSTPYEQVKSHFKRVDEKIYSVALVHEISMPMVSQDLFSDLCETIISQQLSGKAADTLISRFRTLVPDGLTAEAVHKLTPECIREKGISWAKSYSVLDLAQKVVSGDLPLDSLASLDDEAVIAKLIRVKGIGRWSAEMTLMFSLGREDVFSFGDLGLQNGIVKLYGLPQKPTKLELEKLTLPWAPYRTYAAKLLWKFLDNR